MPTNIPRPKELEGMSDEQLRELHQQRKAARAGTTTTQPQGGQDVNAMIQQLMKSQQPTPMQGIGDAITRLGGGTPAPRDTKLNDLVAAKVIDQNFKSPLEQLVERGKAAEAAKNIGDRSLFNTLQQGSGNQPQGVAQEGQEQGEDAYQSLIGDEGKYLNEIDTFNNKPTPRAVEAQARLRLKVNEDAARARANVKTDALKTSVANASKLIERDLDDVLTTYNEIPNSVTGPIQGRTTGQVAKFLQFGKGGKGLAEYDDTVDFIMANIARQLGGERGVLTDQDILRIKRALPQAKDKSGVASAKIARIKRFIQRRVKEAGSDQLPGFGADMEDELTQFAGSEMDAQVNDMLDKLGAE